MLITRFAPSPTGFLHLGNLRVAVLNGLLARQAGGRFILRIDDTDDTRSEARFEAAIRDDLAWLGLGWDESVRQSDRLARYEAAADRLRAAGRLYACYETAEELELRRRIQRAAGRPPVYDRAALRLDAADHARLLAEGRTPHWRFRLDPGAVRWDDAIQGPQAIDPANLSDPVLIRGDGRFLYTLASVVDDADMGITDVVRGADHITNTAVQVQLFEALGAAPPRFAHLSLMTGPGGAALSKRDGAQSVADLRAAGIEPMAVVSLLSRLGSARNVEPLPDLAAAADGFALSAFGTAPVTFDMEQLARLSTQIVHALPFDAVADRLGALGIAGPQAAAFWLAVRPNLARVEDAADWWPLVGHPAEPAIAPEDADFIATALPLLPPLPWDGTSWTTWTNAVKMQTGRKGAALFRPLRRALTGRDHGPDMAAFMPLLVPPHPR